MVRGFNQKRSHEFEHTRAICYNILAVNRDPKKPFPAIEKFWPLSTDEEIDMDAEEKRLLGILEKFKKDKPYK